MIVEVKNAEFSYNGTGNIFEDIKFSVEKGEVFSILGPNGCGKTTLLKCINALLKLKKGKIYIEGNNLKSLERNEIGKKIGYVPQSHDVTFSYTVLEMVHMGRAAHLGPFSSPSSKDIEIAKEAIETLSLSHLRDRSYSNISGGEAQLVLIARALTAQPTMLLLDEPTSHLDFRNQMVILNTLENLAKEKNITTIMTTHFPNHALSISDRALLLGNGKTGIMGDTEDVITEDNLRDVFGINVRIISFKEEENNTKIVVPLRKGVFKN